MGGVHAAVRDERLGETATRVLRRCVGLRNDRVELSERPSGVKRGGRGLTVWGVVGPTEAKKPLIEAVLTIAPCSQLSSIGMNARLQ